ncbi:MAG TPA: hypothetical protein VLA76_05375 [Candidatus Angelobacter sp.]|nr:hypothetical protein [Candidatus Angelobacter sp.]
MKRISTLILAVVMTIAAGCTPADSEATDPVIEDGVTAPGEQ